MTHDDVRELLGAYAVGAVEVNERSLVERHIAECAPCRQEVARLVETASLLSRAVPQDVLPPSLWERISREIQLEPRIPVGHLPFRLVGVIGVAAVLLVFLGASIVWQGIQIHRLQREVSSLHDALALVRMAFARVIPGTTVMELRPTSAAPQARGVAVLRREDGRHVLVLVVVGLPPLPPPSVYQAWLVKDGVRTSAGVFRVGSGGTAVLQYDSPEDLRGYQSLGITRESAGPVPSPRGPRVLGASM